MRERQLAAHSALLESVDVLRSATIGADRFRRHCRRRRRYAQQQRVATPGRRIRVHTGRERAKTRRPLSGERHEPDAGSQPPLRHESPSMPSPHRHSGVSPNYPNARLFGFEAPAARVPGSGTVKVFLPQPELSQNNRSTRRLITTSRPPSAVPDSCRSYRLCAPPRSRHSPVRPSARPGCSHGSALPHRPVHTIDPQRGQVREDNSRRTKISTRNHEQISSSRLHFIPTNPSAAHGSAMSGGYPENQ
ncbi:hypothetical protein DFR76_101559 [Nocardia pseudobrasiliensis]|uniref:Uncharacterized protein n=1 Tax=Nocardia pseudobrasiliensis TaxID=45979 RepID=A0A370IE77_9NOCA|nr:hypothetical protein DFR76_101559 [Nocardia pseudobrasiliensis]